MSPFEKSLHEAPEVSKIGIDIMKAEIPLSETGEHDLDAFIESLSDAVSGGHASQNLKISQTTTSVSLFSSLCRNIHLVSSNVKQRSCP